MNINNKRSIALILLVSLVIILFGSLTVFPWWGFLVPVILTGMFIQRMHWEVRTVAIGFVSGFIVWFGANLYYDLTLNGLILNKIALLLTVSKILLLTGAGLLGGLLTALALYTGKLLLVKSI